MLKMKKSARKIQKSDDFSLLKSKNFKITKKTKFSELLKYPDAVEILLEKGMHCIGCGMASQETIEQGCIAHGIDPDKIVKEINDRIMKKK